MIPFTIGDWVKMIWWALTSPEARAPKTTRDPASYCPTCGQPWRNP